MSRGAGQEVGRSCIILEFKGRKIMVRIITSALKLKSVCLLKQLIPVCVSVCVCARLPACVMWCSWTVGSILVLRGWTLFHSSTWSIRLKLTCFSSASEFRNCNLSSQQLESKHLSFRCLTMMLHHTYKVNKESEHISERSKGWCGAAQWMSCCLSSLSASTWITVALCPGSCRRLALEDAPSWLTPPRPFTAGCCPTTSKSGRTMSKSERSVSKLVGLHPSVIGLRQSMERS